MEESKASGQVDCTVRVFIQARMSSRRFPGKVLAPFRGRPIIARVVQQVATVLPLQHITVLTSIEESDDPLALYVAELGCGLFRGPLDAVFTRFQNCLVQNPCDWFIRISADSPLMDGSILQRALEFKNRSDLDVVTNVFPRTYPKGHSVEMVCSATFAALDGANLTDDEQEHVTRVFYNYPERYRIQNFESEKRDRDGSQESLTIDTLEDYYRLQNSGPVE